MHSAMRHNQSVEPGMPIRGTFYPSDGPRGAASVLPKLLALLVALALVRMVVRAGGRHGGPSRWSRRREAIAEFHRELHAQDDATRA
jgi:hypothetical protein